MLYSLFSSYLCLLTHGFNFFFFFWLRIGTLVSSPLCGQSCGCCGGCATGTVAGDPSDAAVFPSSPRTRPPAEREVQLLLLAVSTVYEPVGLLDGRLVDEHGVLGVAGLQRVVLLVLVSCRGKRQGHA